MIAEVGVRSQVSLLPSQLPVEYGSPMANPGHPSLSDIYDRALLQPRVFYKAPGADDFLGAQLPPEFLKRRPKVLT